MIWSPTVCWVNHAKVNISIRVVSPVGREGDRFTTRPKENESHDKNDDLGPSIQTRTQNVVELQKPLGFVSPEIVLTPPSDEEEADNGRIDSSDEPSNMPTDDRHVEDVETDFGKESV